MTVPREILYMHPVWSFFFGPCSCNTASFMLDELYASLHCKKAIGLHHINVHKNWIEPFPSVTAPSVFAVASFHKSPLSICSSRSWGFTATEAEWHPWLNLNNITSFPFLYLFVNYSSIYSSSCFILCFVNNSVSFFSFLLLLQLKKTNGNDKLLVV